jgi:NADH:ubiquinone oxidoreductase subunit D
VAVRHNGDMMDNYLIRFDEIRQSLRILEQALKQIPGRADQLTETGVPGPGSGR